jgi:DNA-binding transcriptional regulator of glucitol operon
VAGEIVTEILVAGSVQVDVELEEDVVAVVVVQVIAVLAVAWWQEGRLRTAMNSVNRRDRFTGPLSSIFVIPNAYGSVSNLILKM